MRVGQLHIGVRADTEETLGLLRRLLGCVVVEDVEAPANYSVRLGSSATTRGRPAELAILYRASQPLVRARDAERVLAGLCRHLASHGEPGGELLRVRATVAVGNGTAVLAPPDARQRLGAVERRLEQRGVRLVDAPFADLDPETGELVVPPVPLVADESVLAEVGGREEHRHARVVAPGRYPVAHVVLVAPRGHASDVSRVQALVLAADHVVAAPALGSQRTLEGLVAAIADYRVTPPPGTPGAWLELLTPNG